MSDAEIILSVEDMNVLKEIEGKIKFTQQRGTLLQADVEMMKYSESYLRLALAEKGKEIGDKYGIPVELEWWFNEDGKVVEVQKPIVKAEVKKDGSVDDSYVPSDMPDNVGENN